MLALPFIERYGDLGVRGGFNKKIEFKFTKLAPSGDPYCEWFEEIED